MAEFFFDGNRVWYEVSGKGKPLLLLHGNSVSSHMFRIVEKFYQNDFQIIKFDYPGHGKSDRLEIFNDNFWKYNSEAAKTLLDLLNIQKVNIIGTSGGALVGLNLASNYPDLVSKIIADSFFGEHLPLVEAIGIMKSREISKKKFMSIAFWKSMHGWNWKKVVDLDTEMLIRISEKELDSIQGIPYDIKAKVLITASREDELIPDIESRMKVLAEKIPDCTLQIFDIGKHPFMITQQEAFRKLSLDFFKD